MRAPKVAEVWECGTCGWRYGAPIHHTGVLCPHPHVRKSRSCHVVWSKKADGGDPPLTAEGGQ